LAISFAVGKGKKRIEGGGCETLSAILPARRPGVEGLKSELVSCKTAFPICAAPVLYNPRSRGFCADPRFSPKRSFGVAQDSSFDQAQGRLSLVAPPAISLRLDCFQALGIKRFALAPQSRIRYKTNMGVFRVPKKVRNWQNRFLPADRRGEDVQCEALVDSGAAEFALPVDILERLPLEHLTDVRDDGGEHDYRVFGIAEVEVQGRVCHVRVIELPHGAEPLLGAVPLEEMDWHISPLEKRLVPNPRSPEKPLLPLV
jgi:predicted aspartyl protease